MRLTDAARPVFARHETFHPRYGWFRKAYTAVAGDPSVFGRADAPLEIGVGKNMVRAIRFWGLAGKLIVEDPKAENRRSPGLVPTRFGHALFGESGWDRFMEDPGTLWVLHWLLLAPPSRLPVWWLAFNEFNAVEFEAADLFSAASIQLETAAEWRTPHRSSLNKDVNVLLRTYATLLSGGGRFGSRGLDDLLDCPLRELGLISRSEPLGRYRFALGPKPALPSSVAVYAVLDYIARTGTVSAPAVSDPAVGKPATGDNPATATTRMGTTADGSRTATLSRIACEPGAPGRAFKLNESEMLAVITPVVEQTNGLRLTRLTGAPQLAWSDDPAGIAARVLDDYYGTSALGAAAGPAGDEAIDDDLVEALGLGRNPSPAIRRLHATSLSHAGAVGAR